MFCPNCGTKVLDDADFCQKCGAKLIKDASAQSAASNPDSVQLISKAPAAVPKKKKSKKLFILLAIVFALIVILIIANAYDWADTKSQQDSKSVNLSQTYTNEKEGISFKYPSAWVPVSEDEFIDRFGKVEGEEYPIVLLANEIEDLPEENTYIMVSRFDVAQDKIDRLFVDDEQFASTFDSDAKVFDTSTIEIDGVAARKIMYDKDEIGYQSYFYAVGSVLYRIDFSYKGTPGNNQRFFDAIIDSYKITATDTGEIGEGAADGNAFEAAGGAADGDAPGFDEAGNEASEVATVAVDEASENAALQILADWFQRRPLMHNIKVEFMEEGLDAGDGTIYLPYIMYIEQEEYGFFVVNPDTGDMVMDSVLDDQGELVEIQVSMDQWYLEYYWGWTDDSGYHSEPYSDDIYEIYNGEGALILEYYSSHDSYAICDYDGRSFLEYDDGSAASEVVLADFAGSYWSDQSAEVEGTFVENGYGLEIGEWDGYCFSIAETWRGMDLLKDDWCVPQSLILNTLTFVTYSSEGGTHTLTYVPAEYSPLGQDVVYLDGDETMPFVRN